VLTQPESNRQPIQQRLNLLYYPILLVFLVLAARLWQLQIIQGREYAERAERNRIRTIQVVAPRGTICDRTGRPLVENRPSFNIVLYREEIEDPDATARYITERLGVTPEDLEARVKRDRGSGLYRPVIIKEDVGIEDISTVEAHRRDHPEVQLGPEPRRSYRFGRLAAHVLGYVGEVSKEELEQSIFPGAKTGSLVGKSGVERTYNQHLVGKDGERRVLVDSLGREVGMLDDIDSVRGSELRLTLDLDLQTIAENLLQDKTGAIVAMDPRDGGILAMASSPAFNPNSFAARISEEDWSELVNNPNYPMQNRAIQNSYAPGSIFKVIMAEAGLEEALAQADATVTCRGAAVYYGRVFHCASKDGHGTINLETAIQQSCNIFFYELGRQLGISKIAEHAQSLGLGNRTGIDLPNERSGVMPSPEWKERVNGTKWYAGETISVSIGQGAVSTTPLQIVRAISAIATGGKLTTPHVFLRVEDAPDSSFVWPITDVHISGETASRIREGMWRSVNRSGTGRNAAVPGMDICGKTGTVQVLSNETRKGLGGETSGLEDHSWFAGFASKDNPEIAIVVFVEHGGKGGIAAAPLAQDLFSAYFTKKQQPELLPGIAGPLAEGPQ
jgi:penicillin-binding protein 2